MSEFLSEKVDRGPISITARAPKKTKSLKIFVAIALAVATVAVVAALIWSKAAAQAAQQSAQSNTPTDQVAGVDKHHPDNSDGWLNAIQKKINQEKRNTPAQATDPAQSAGATTQPAPAPQLPMHRTYPATSYRPTPAQQSTTLTPSQRKRTGTLLVAITGAKQPHAKGLANADDTFDAPTFANGFAKRTQPNGLDFLLPHGSVIPCALYTQVISDYQGIVTCRVTQDIYSANGKALLIERGSQLTGTQKVQLSPGKSRLFTTWGDIQTPNGVSVRVDSLGAGRLGASGNQAWVDNHFQQRFGGAILLSFLDDAFSALAEQASQSDANISFDNSTENASNIAEKALDSSINITPTGYTQIGQRINILVARDIDLSTVYQFEHLSDKNHQGDSD